MNCIYRLVWSRVLRTLQVASEPTRGAPDGSNESSKRRSLHPAPAVEGAVAFGNCKKGLSFALPPGIQLTSDARVAIFPIERKSNGE